MLTRSVLAAGLLAAMSSAWATNPTLPSAHLKTDFTATELLSIPPADVRSLVGEDSKAQGQAMRVGVVQRVDRQLLAGGDARIGEWVDGANGKALWTLDLASAGAVSLDLQFSRLGLPDGAELYLSNADRSYVLGPIRGSDALADGSYYTALIPGDSLRLEVQVDAAQRANINLHLDGVGYGYRGVLGMADHPDAIRSGACNIDVACPLGTGWQDQIDAVGQYIFTRSGSNYVCTGSLIGNTNSTPVPYFITANHCVSTEAVAQTMRIYWNYQSTTCRTPGSGASGTSLPRPATFSNGAALRMTYATNDTSLVELNAPVPPAENPFFLGWDRRNLATPGNPQVTGAVSIHHPAGHEKRITKDDDSLSVTTYLSDTATPTGSHYRIGQWEHGTTEGGSSGSALFSAEKRLIGTLHGGYASCSSITQDWYGRIHQSWAGGGSNATRLSNWLDPAATAPETFDGYRGVPLDNADLEIALSATPDPVDIGEELSIIVDVDNNGPGNATSVVVALSLPADLAYTSTSSSSWTCGASAGTVSCSLTGGLANGASAETLTVLADVVATETGNVIVSAEVSASNPDPVSGNNAASVEVEITGKPPLPDHIFCDGFEDGGDGSCAAPVDPDIVVIDNINFVPNPDFTGGSITWLDGTTCVCDIAPYNLNVYGSAATVQFFWPNNSNGSEGGVSSDGTTYAVLQSGATVGASSQFLVATTLGNASAWYSPGNVDGYLGFRFLNNGITKYGYAHVTTGAGGRPFTIHSITYNNVGDPITIP